MADLQVKSLIFKKIPAGRLVPGEHIEVVSNPADLTLPPTGGLSFKLLQVGLDPFMRDRMHESTKDRYVPVFDLGSPINNSCIAKVIESSIDDFEKDDLITAILPFAEYGVLPKELLGPLQVAKVVELPPGIDHSLLLGPLGLAGATAWVSYFGIVKEDQEGLRAHPGKSFDVTHRGADIKTMWVSSAASSVGQIVGQLAKRDGYRVIGSVGSDEKLDFIVNTLGYDAGFNYKTEKAKDAIPRLAPDGLDCYYDNVGGDHLQAALDNMKPHGTICCCGSISTYNVTEEERFGMTNYGEIFRRRITIRGFTFHELMPEYGSGFKEKMAKMIADGSIKAEVNLYEGFDNIGQAFVDMLDGKATGKVVVRVAEP